MNYMLLYPKFLRYTLATPNEPIKSKEFFSHVGTDIARTRRQVTVIDKYRLCNNI